ncbi:MAG: tellurite resistance TerB family protein [Polyangiaceae bacterium]|nr:tellurite resistance TerB family protein [Polyangiaceae bacterium]
MRVDKIMSLANSVLGGQRSQAIKLIAQGAHMWAQGQQAQPQATGAATSAQGPLGWTPSAYGPSAPSFAAPTPQQPPAAETGLESDEWALLRVMAAAAQADGHVAPHEQNTILGQAQKMGASVQQIQQLGFELHQRVSLREIVGSVDSIAVRKFMYQFAFAIVKSDHQFSQQEVAFLNELAASTELSHDVLGRLVQ